MMFGAKRHIAIRHRFRGAQPHGGGVGDVEKHEEKAKPRGGGPSAGSQCFAMLHRHRLLLMRAY
jgi:hypothetical protein